MTADIQQRFRALNVWKNGDKRAPHKPLLALWAIGRCLRGEPRLAPYELVDPELAHLLRRFGPHRKTTHTEAPFWRMQFDGVWEVDRPMLVRTTSKGDAYKVDLRSQRIRGGLTKADYSMLQRNPSLAWQLAGNLVASHFPTSQHDTVLEATLTASEEVVGAEPWDSEQWTVARRRRRDPKFRAKVLEAYGSRCAVCKFAGRLRNEPVGIEAAHIKWHEAKGPAEVENGLSLCALHHDLFDKGAFTLLPEMKVIVADAIQGEGVDSVLHQYHGEPLRVAPHPGFSFPDPAFLAWHRTEVFRVPELVR